MPVLSLACFPPPRLPHESLRLHVEVIPHCPGRPRLRRLQGTNPRLQPGNHRPGPPQDHRPRPSCPTLSRRSTAATAISLPRSTAASPGLPRAPARASSRSTTSSADQAENQPQGLPPVADHLPRLRRGVHASASIRILTATSAWVGTARHGALHRLLLADLQRLGLQSLSATRVQIPATYSFAPPILGDRSRDR